MRRLGTVIVVALAAFGLIVGIDLAAYAANGHSLLLGRSNSATSVTTLKNSQGTALALDSRAGYPPFRTSDSGKVYNLNADKVDGLSYERLVNRMYTGTSLSGSSGAGKTIKYALPQAPAGSYLMTYTVKGNRTNAGAVGSMTQCVLYRGSTLLSAGQVMSNNSGNIYASVSGSAAFSGDPAEHHLQCTISGDGTWYNTYAYPTTITLMSGYSLATSTLATLP